MITLEDRITAALLNAYWSGHGDGTFAATDGICNLAHSMDENVNEVLESGTGTIVDNKTLTEYCRAAAKNILKQKSKAEREFMKKFKSG